MNNRDIQTQDKILQVINDAVYTSKGRYLKDIEEQVLLGSLKKQKYHEIAEEHGYCTKYISQDVGFNLWKMLTEALGESVNKNNIKSVSRRAVRNSSFGLFERNKQLHI